ncbi:hypothetical protein COE30_21630 [Bacillus cereus]|uniref:tyrosine-type recombinase/integrase n=1 Tax=Bacillus cereus TaxID=1396 RepID=UPI000BFC82CA|nr:tyrosine-type recombinase/integrase [Bacillus cereus]PGZ06318.1 hypothetical protein COE30_21630 [Bacillus cereus]
MINTNDFYDEEEIKSITENIEKYQFGNILKILLGEWLQTSGMQNILLERPFIMYPVNKKENVKVVIIKCYIEILGKFILKQEDFTWENYCKIMHEIPLGKRKGFHSPFRQLTRGLYLHALASDTITNSQVKSFIARNNSLLLTREFKRVEGKQNYTPYINNCIRTNFPINSSAEQIIQVEYFHNDGSVNFVNFFLPTCSQFLLNTIKKFLNILPKRKLNKFDNRVVVTLFEESLGGQEINSLEDFNEQTFKQQLLYFNSFVESNHTPMYVYFKQFLVKFYRYIDGIYLEENGVRLFNSFSFNRDLIIHKHYLTSIEQCYKSVNLNSLGAYPKSDKWFVVADPNKHGTHIANSKNSLMNFELVHNIEFRNALKDYIWKLDLSYNNTSSHFCIMVDFLNEADSYYQQERQMLQLNNLLLTDLKPFSSRFLIFYYASLVSNKEYTDLTINYNVKAIRKFIKHIQSRYNIPNVMMEQFTTIDVNDKGGTPISLEDFKEIQEEFEKKFNNENEIMLIILQLAIETKLRLGEIFALERDCIISIDDGKKFGTIQYYAKTSGRKKIKEVLVIEHIRLLQKATEITQPLKRMAENSLKKYIFLCNYNRYKDQIIAAIHPFYKAFRTISQKLFEQGKIKLKYTPNNLRHTYIEKAWQMVEDGLISTLEVGIITGNSAVVAAKHYRNKENTKRYVEALYEVSILDDELPGAIVDSKTVENLPPVQNGAGNCASESCVKIDTDEDSFYKCLTCIKFVTTVERTTIFEQRMKVYMNKKENSSSVAERNFYTVLIELYGSYLAEMYAIMEGKV